MRGMLAGSPCREPQTVLRFSRAFLSRDAVTTAQRAPRATLTQGEEGGGGGLFRSTVGTPGVTSGKTAKTTPSPPSLHY